MKLEQFVLLPEQILPFKEPPLPADLSLSWSGIQPNQSITEFPPLTNNIIYIQSQDMKGRKLVSFCHQLLAWFLRNMIARDTVLKCLIFASVNENQDLFGATVKRSMTAETAGPQKRLTTCRWQVNVCEVSEILLVLSIEHLFGVQQNMDLTFLKDFCVCTFLNCQQRILR